MVCSSNFDQKLIQNEATCHPNGAQMHPVRPPNVPGSFKMDQEVPRWPQGRSKRSPRTPKMAPRGTNMAPREPNMTPRGSKMAPKGPKMAPRWSQEASKGGKLGATMVSILEIVNV